MSETPAESDGFQYSDTFTRIGSKKKRKPKGGQGQAPLRDRVRSAKQGLVDNPWMGQCQSLLRESINSLAFAAPEVLCLGLGTPSASTDARIQFAFLLVICESLHIDHSSVSLFDPAFLPEDSELFAELQLCLLSENRHGDHAAEAPTIFFMPHCDMTLYEGVLNANWTLQRLGNMLLIGNPISEYIANNPARKMETSFPRMMQIAPLLACHPLPTSSEWPNAFNNTAIQFVRRAALTELSSDRGFFEPPRTKDPSA